MASSLGSEASSSSSETALGLVPANSKEIFTVWSSSLNSRLVESSSSLLLGMMGNDDDDAADLIPGKSMKRDVRMEAAIGAVSRIKK